MPNAREKVLEMLSLSEQAIIAIKDRGEHLATLKLSEPGFDRFCEQLWPTVGIDGAELSSRTLNAHRRIQDLTRSIYDQDHNANIRGTAWGAYNAAVEYHDWHRRAPRDGDLFRRNLDANELRITLEAAATLAAGA